MISLELKTKYLGSHGEFWIRCQLNNLTFPCSCNSLYPFSMVVIFLGYLLAPWKELWVGGEWGGGKGTPSCHNSSNPSKIISLSTISTLDLGSQILLTIWEWTCLRRKKVHCIDFFFSLTFLGLIYSWNLSLSILEVSWLWTTILHKTRHNLELVGLCNL